MKKQHIYILLCIYCVVSVLMYIYYTPTQSDPFIGVPVYNAMAVAYSVIALYLRFT